MMRFPFALAAFLVAAPAMAGVGDPQVRTDHPWYPGELSCSTFDRLFATEAELFRRVVGETPTTDEQKALAAWLWRNTHYCHGEEGASDLWGKGFRSGMDLRNREYWMGLFAHGYGLCGTTHSQWTAELNALFGHNHSRGVGAAGHNSFEVFLTGGPYGPGKWVLLDHDLSTVVYNETGTALLSAREVTADWKRLTDRRFAPGRQHGWPICGLYPGDAASYKQYNGVEYLPGYAGPPPMVHLRRGEKLRRYLRPGLADGKTYVFWGRNYRTNGVPGPERSHTWVNQPERFYGSRTVAGYHPGQARFANAVFTYEPDFADGSYREDVVAEDANRVVFEFVSPYVIAATPPNDQPWGIYDSGCRNGLVLHGRANCAVAITTDLGRTWQQCGPFVDGLDLTDRVKGRRQYQIRFGAGAAALAGSGLTMTTVCEANAAILPHLKDNGSQVTFVASGRAIASAGPEIESARTRIVAGNFGTPSVTLEIASPRHEPAVTVYAAAHVASGNPPDPKVKYRIDYSTDAGRTWRPLVRDWSITRRGDEPADFWSQSFCYGSAAIAAPNVSAVRIRFSNTGRKAYPRCEAHLSYRVANSDATRVTFAWTDAAGPHVAAHVVPSGKGPTTWTIPTGKHVRTDWVEFAPVK